MQIVPLTSSGKKCKRCISKMKVLGSLKEISNGACWQHCNSPKSKSKSHGCSNIKKYKGVSPELFCGPAGGSCPGTYPVNTPKRVRAALAYARHAPYPEGIKKCARKIAREKGW